jgi:hypothetical protein
MAGSTLQKEVERWVISIGLPEKFGQAFESRSLSLDWGGKFEFDGVSHDESIGVCVSTSSYKTGGQKAGSGKAQKIKADTLYLLFAKTLKRRVHVFTEADMMEYLKDSAQKEGFPHLQQSSCFTFLFPEILLFNSIWPNTQPLPK